MLQTEKIYFPSLNGIRFFAAFLVFLDHLELFKSYLGLKPIWSDFMSNHLGGMGVTIFFVLSGFLITFLLLSEKNKFKTISIKQFYIRRILRIWPLYYFILVLSFFVIPELDFFELGIHKGALEQFFGIKLFLFLVLLPNLAFVFFPIVPFGNVLWSVGVEEQFYLFWPHVLKKTKKLFQTILLILILLLLIKFLFRTNVFKLEEGISKNINQMFYYTRFSSMLIGALGAYVYFNKLRILALIYSKYLQIISLLILVLLLLRLTHLPFLSYYNIELESVAIVVLLLNFATNPKSVFTLEFKWFNFLGRISYGFYLYHSIIIMLVIKSLLLVLDLDNFNPILVSLTVFTFSFLITILISYLSYFYFEQLFLNLKQKYVKVMSTDYFLKVKK